MAHPRNNDHPDTRVRNNEQVDVAVRKGLHDAGQKSVEKYITCTGTIVWYCGKFTVFLYAGDLFLERMSDTELVEWVVSTMVFRVQKGVF